MTRLAASPVAAAADEGHEELLELRPVSRPGEQRLYLCVAQLTVAVRVDGIKEVVAHLHLLVGQGRVRGAAAAPLLCALLGELLEQDVAHELCREKVVK